MTELQSPFPFFGGKSTVADTVWKRFGDTPNFVEPFFGSGAVLLRRPDWHNIRTETVTDKDGLICNFWRSIQHDPEQTAFYADYPVIESDLHARHLWLVGQKENLTAKLEGDPEYYDCKTAGWWVWGMSCWIGAGFCAGSGPWAANEQGEMIKMDHPGGINRGLPHLSGHQGVNRVRPHLSSSVGVHRKLPRLSDDGSGVNSLLLHMDDAAGVHRKIPAVDTRRGVISPNRNVYDWFELLSARLRRVRVCCGDWSRIVGPSPTVHVGLTGIFLDPPYSLAERCDNIYVEDSNVAVDVAKWARDNGDNPMIRAALCGYESEHQMPDTWSVYRWKAQGGYGNQGDQRGAENRYRECIWFSPHCLKGEQGRLF